jgi:hypothetical protein
VRCEQRSYPIVRTMPYHERSTLDSILGTDTDTATLDWLASALEQARARGQWKAVGYLEAVLDDVVFEMESASRRG